MRKKPVRKLLVACIAGALFLPKIGFTLGLGEIEVNSALNQQLNAEIELLSAAPEDAETLIVKLASRQEFTRAGLDRPFLLNDLRFKTVILNDVPHIKVSTTTPVREPFLNFLMEVDWPKGHLLREYTILLDPPTFMTQTSSALTSSSPAAASSDDSGSGFRPTANGVVAVTAPAVAAGATSFRPGSNANAVASSASQPVAATQARASADYRIKSGDTSWSLADKMRPDSSVSVEQMMMALLRANPDSFINENINGLKRGYVLRAPDRADIAALSSAQARAMVKEHSALWREYQQNYAGATPSTAVDDYAPDSTADTAQSGVSSEAADAHLQIVSAGSGASTGGEKDPTQMTATELREALAQARENIESERVEKELLNEEIDMLEHQLGKMQGLLVIEGGELADAQALGDDAVTDADAPPTDALLEEADVAVEEMPEAAAEMSDEMPADEAAEESMAAESEQVFVDEASEEVLVETESEVIAEEEPAAVAPAKPQAADPLTQLLNDPMMLAAAGGGLLFLLAMIYLVIKRRKSATEEAVAEPAEAMQEPANLEDVADMVEEDLLDEMTEAEEAVVDTEATMILETPAVAEDTVVSDDFDEIVEDEEEPRDDVIAEADVYLAYGIYQQAEDLLVNAINESPERDDYRVKLAETQFAAKNVDGFIQIATELKERKADENSSSWKKVAAMGLDLCPDHALFQGSSVESVDVDVLAPQEPEPMDFDLGLDEDETEDAELEVPDLDLSLDEDESIDLPDMNETADEAAILDIGDADEVADINELEFDLSETDAIAEEMPAESESDDTALEDLAAEPETDEEEFSLDIDASELDIDEDELDKVEVASADEMPAEDVIDLSGMDDAMDATMKVDAEELNIEMEAVSTADDAASADELDLDFGLDDDTAEADDIDISLDDALETEEDVSMAAADEIEIDLSGDTDDLDLGLDDAIDMTLDAEADTTAEADSIDLDMGMDLDAGEPAEDDFDLSSLGDADEVSTKLDLARAYLDMGDHDGTREILNEVVAEGTDEQKKEANELLSQLDS